MQRVSKSTLWNAIKHYKYFYITTKYAFLKGTSCICFASILLLFCLFVLNCFSSIFHRDRWFQLCSVASSLFVAMQRNASYLRPFSVVSSFRLTTQNSWQSASAFYFLLATELNIYQVSSGASYLFLLQPWKKNVFASNWFSSSLPIYISPLNAVAK